MLDRKCVCVCVLYSFLKNRLNDARNGSGGKQNNVLTLTFFPPSSSPRGEDRGITSYEKMATLSFY